MTNIFKDEEGTYGTVPDGDKPSQDEIIKHNMKQNISKKQWNANKKVKKAFQAWQDEACEQINKGDIKEWLDEMTRPCVCEMIEFFGKDWYEVIRRYPGNIEFTEDRGSDFKCQYDSEGGLCDYLWDEINKKLK